MNTAQIVVLFTLSMVLLLFGHVLRSARHVLLFPDGIIGKRFDLLLGLSLGYAINSILPFHIGEIVRTLFVAVRYNLYFGQVAATVLAERLSDMVAVALIFSLLLATVASSTDVLSITVFTLMGLACLLVGFAILVIQVKALRRGIWGLASIFSDRIRLCLVDFTWRFSQIVVSGELVSRKYVVCTIAIWALYLSAYALFASAFGISLADVTVMLLGAPHRSLLDQIFSREASLLALALLLFTSVPVLAVLIYGAMHRWQQISRSVSLVREFGLGPIGSNRPMLKERFASAESYADFLHSHFSAQDSPISSFSIAATEGAVVHRLLPGGSDAVTALVGVGDRLVIRKFATGGAGEKLKTQAAWLHTYRGDLPLADVSNEQRGSSTYCYDMPYLLSARDFYDVIHSSSIDTSMQVLEEVADRISHFHQQNAEGEASPEVIDAYIEEKIKGNAKKIMAFASAVLPGQIYEINGEQYDLTEWDILNDSSWLRTQIRSRNVGVVHGDLTIENIIVCEERKSGWYIIDPNPDNIFNTPLIDWAKLMQSLNLGYENLNRGGHSILRNNVIQLAFMKSSAYGKLHARLMHTLGSRFGASCLNEIAFHELVNYLRLTPYKIRQNPKKGLAFFACTSILLRRYLDGQVNGDI